LLKEIFLIKQTDCENQQSKRRASYALVSRKVKFTLSAVLTKRNLSPKFSVYVKKRYYTPHVVLRRKVLRTTESLEMRIYKLSCMNHLKALKFKKSH